jgi:hypothetical protein
VCIYSVLDRAVVAWGEGHRSWVSAVAFDQHWECPSSSSGLDAVPDASPTYRIVSVAQDCQVYRNPLPLEPVMPLSTPRRLVS